eukprot:909147-Pyramimonas_sp.AAC.1
MVGPTLSAARSSRAAGFPGAMTSTSSALCWCRRSARKRTKRTASGRSPYSGCNMPPRDQAGHASSAKPSKLCLAHSENARQHTRKT